jgi:hypothetical protein
MLTSDHVDPLIDDVSDVKRKQTITTTTRIGDGLLNSIIKEANSHEETTKKGKKHDDAQRRALQKLDNAFHQKFPLLSSLDTVQLSGIWQTSLDQTKLYIAHIFATDSQEPASPQQESVMDMADDVVRAMIELHDLVGLFIQVLHHPDHHVCPEAVMTVTMLHSLLLYINSESNVGLKLQDRIAQLCEAWYLHDLHESDQVVAQTVLFLLYKSISPSGTTNGTILKGLANPCRCQKNVRYSYFPDVG